jgi:hypothetical protein
MVVIMVLSCGVFFYCVSSFTSAHRYCNLISAINATSEANDLEMVLLLNSLNCTNNCTSKNNMLLAHIC